jgi:hypothetical protein
MQARPQWLVTGGVFAGSDPETGPPYSVASLVNLGGDEQATSTSQPIVSGRRPANGAIRRSAGQAFLAHLGPPQSLFGEFGDHLIHGPGLELETLPLGTALTVRMAKVCQRTGSHEDGSRSDRGASSHRLMAVGASHLEPEVSSLLRAVPALEPAQRYIRVPSCRVGFHFLSPPSWCYK